jgi:competence protein ComEA
MPSGGVAVEASQPAFGVRGVVGAISSDSASPAPADAPAGTLFVDVEGAVEAPGVRQLPNGSRIGDAIAAAGGYGADVDIAAAGRTLNLASRLTDGQQINVPALGDPVDIGGDGPATTAAPGNAGGLVDINHASSDELDTLPGVGPVTAQKIIDARTEQPFATIDELQSRGVVGAATFDKLRDLITVNP